MGGIDIPAPEQPEEKNQYTKQDNELVSSRYIDANGDVQIENITPAEEKEREAKRQSQLEDVNSLIEDFLPTMNTVNPILQNQIDAQAQQMSQEARKGLTQSYNDVMNAVKSSAASRYGSTQNSYYDQLVSGANKTLAEQESQLAADIEAQKSQLINEELSRKQSYLDNLNNQALNLQNGISYLDNLQNERYQNTLNSANMSNNFDASNYSTAMQKYVADVNSATQQRGQNMGIFSMLFSDVALKENVKPLERVLDKLDNIGCYNYNYIWDKEPQTGVMAQELEKEFPELVGTHHNGYKYVNYNGLVPILLQAIKELKQQLKGE